MATRARIFGRECTWTVDPDGVGRWRYPDGTVAAECSDPADGSTFRYTNPLPCPACAELPLPGGEDPCLGVLPGVTSACCGHGRKENACIAT